MNEELGFLRSTLQRCCSIAEMTKHDSSTCISNFSQFLASQAISPSTAAYGPYGQAAAATSCHVPPHVLRESLHQNESFKIVVHCWILKLMDVQPCFGCMLNACWMMLNACCMHFACMLHVACMLQALKSVLNAFHILWCMLGACLRISNCEFFIVFVSASARHSLILPHSSSAATTALDPKTWHAHHGGTSLTLLNHT
jgi:hypothetical protein